MAQVEGDVKNRMRKYILGIDLGVNSLGAALIDSENQAIVWTGVRIFSGPFEGDYSSGIEESRARQRRTKRQLRRQIDRRRRRLQRVFTLLQRFGLLPSGERRTVLPALDAELRKRYPETETLPYFLRGRALDVKLEPFEIGRCLYHLAQRRGFQGRAAFADPEEKSGGKFGDEMKGLWNEICSSGARTLGEFLARQPAREVRLRGRHTHRLMYEQEFNLIWDAQKQHHPEILTPEHKALLFQALFFQRPLKSATHLIGDCSLERGEKRAPCWTLQVQRFRVLSAVNNLRVVEPSGKIRPLEPQERELLAAESLRREQLKFSTIRRILKLDKDCRFTVEEGGEDCIPGNATSARIYKVMGDEWLKWPQDRQEALVAILGDTSRYPTDDDLVKELVTALGLPPENATRLCAVALPTGYASISLDAIAKVKPSLEKGMTFAEARRILWPEDFTEKPPLALLPPVCDTDLKRELRNPAVLRALSELRKVVNAVIREFGKPVSIHIELSRDLKRNRKERQQESERMRSRERARSQARTALAPYYGENVPNREIEKYLLWEECGHRCPYTGEVVALSDLFGPYPRFEVEHIIPFDRCLDDSFQNKTLCEINKNREKGKRTPWEAFGHTPEWPSMVERVRAFGNSAKLRRFIIRETEAERLLEEFSSRQLNDARYASRLAARYLGLLYGIQGSDNRRIIVCAGAVTAYLRQEWDLNRILSAQPVKSREDHRHHAVDALAVALATPAQIKALAECASRAPQVGRRRFAPLPDPWPGFRDQARRAILGTLVSHRPQRKLKAALHEDTYYSPPVERDGKLSVRCRKPVNSLSANEINAIVDPTVRETVRKAWEEVGRDSKKLLNNWPLLQTRRGDLVPIKRVRYYKTQQVQPIAAEDPARTRYVIPGGNHHMEIWAVLDRSTGKPIKWASETISVLEAHRRYRQGSPIIQRDHGPDTRFCFSLSEGDLVKTRRSERDSERIWYVRSVKADGRVVMSPATDARKKEDISKSGELWQVSVNPLMRLGAAKVVVTPLGKVIYAHD